MLARHSVGRQSGRTLVAAIGLALAFAAPAIAAPDAPAVLKGLAACQRISPTEPRLRCFDDLARRSLGETPAQSPSVTLPGHAAMPGSSASLAPSTTTQITPSVPAPVTEVRNAPIAQDEAPASHHAMFDRKFDKLTLVIAKVEPRRAERTRLTMTDGTVLELIGSTDSLPGYPSPGDSVTVVPRMLGYRCQLGRRNYLPCMPVDGE